MHEPEQERREECRREVRRYLWERSAVALRPAAIRRGLDREYGFTEREITDALAFLASDKQAAIEPDDLGATEYFKITAEGIRRHERGK